MALNKAWRDLHRARFAELPLDCGNELDAGIIYSEDLRDWSDKATTPDQVRMENYIDRFDLRQSRVLHIGIGNSGFARRFHNRVRAITGTTIDQPEIEVARALSLPNYDVVMHNKYSGRDEAFEGEFDFILDNNPTSPCCCLRHLSDLFDFYVAKLAPDGQIVTDRIGLGWVPEGSPRRWSFDFDDLAAVASAAELSAFRRTPSVYVMSQSPPRDPGPLSRTRHALRRVAAFPGRVIRNAPSRLIREYRRLAAALTKRSGSMRR